jgi:flavin reductase (DIM6/NTAB) family NADH-FMN oxidoreductase RutF
MPHDRKGNLLNVGDHVIIEATVTHVHTGEEYCNLTLETIEPMYPDNSPSTLSLNAKQVTRTGANDEEGKEI